jgi:hypothetical protein
MYHSAGLLVIQYKVGFHKVVAQVFLSGIDYTGYS